MKFLRKLRYKSLKNSKLSKYLGYAIGEILLVVIGIFIAIQVNEIYEQKKQDTEGDKILRSLLTEFKLNQSQLEGLISDYIWVYDSADYLIGNYGEQLNEIPRRTLDSLMGGILYVPEYYPSESVYNLAISTGKYDLIKNDSLKIAISNTIGLLPLYKMTSRRVEDVTFNRLHKIIDDEGYLMKDILGGRLTSFGKYREKTPKHDYSSIFENIEFENTLELRRICTADILAVSRMIKESQDNAIIKIEKELNK